MSPPIGFRLQAGRAVPALGSLVEDHVAGLGRVTKTGKISIQLAQVCVLCVQIAPTPGKN